MPLTIQETKAKHEQRSLALPGVISAGIGRAQEGTLVMGVGLDRHRPQTLKELPRVLEKYAVNLKIVGPVRAL